MSYKTDILSAMAAVMAPYFHGSASFTSLQVPQAPSLLETLASSSAGQGLDRNNQPAGYNQPIRVPFHRGILPESKKSPAPPQQRVHGYRAPRCSYRKAAEHK